MRNHLLRHLQVIFYSLGELARAPLTAFMTVAVIGITLALPAALYALLGNLQRVSGGWDEGAQISVFLRLGTSQTAAQALAGQIRVMPGVANVRYISPDAALKEFKRLSGFGNTLDLLDSNPLPAVLLVRPTRHGTRATAAQKLAQTLGKFPGVAQAQFDLEWVRRLDSILQLAQRGVLILALLLGIAVVLVVGNTIRLAILNRRSEIEVIKLIGGTDAFIRRPFLYTGLFQGLLGGLLAWILVAGSLALLAGPVRNLAGLYGSDFELAGLGLRAGTILLLGGAVLGWSGSRIAVGRHLRAIEPG
ncbi:MAG: permease-like cell division protein FtsX [Acidiferrobacterales bacterium]